MYEENIVGFSVLFKGDVQRVMLLPHYEEALISLLTHGAFKKLFLFVSLHCTNKGSSLKMAECLSVRGMPILMQNILW